MTPRAELWYDGPNYTADAIIIDVKHQTILLIKRCDCHEWALPGGFLDNDESSLQAAQREAFEETGASVTNGQLVYQGIVDDPRNTMTAWIETSAYLFSVANVMTIAAGDDARDARWFSLNELPTAMYASHRSIIETALNTTNE